MLETLIIMLFTLIGVITQRIVGFGIAPFVAPVILIFFSPPIAVVSTIMIGTISSVIILIQKRKNSSLMPKLVLRILLAAIPGLIIGAYIVTRIEKAYLQILVGTVVIVGILVQEFFLPKPTRKLGITNGITASGFFTGLLNATAANGAPPMAIWLRSHIATPDQIRENLAGMFICVNICSMFMIYLLKPATYSSELLWNVALLTPMIIIGNIIGLKLMRQVDKKVYEKLVVFTIILTGLVSISLGIIKLT